jgi:hypothetical protein
MAIKWVSPDTPAHHPTVHLSDVENGPVIGSLKYTNLELDDGDDTLMVKHAPATTHDWIQKPPSIPDDKLAEIAEDIKKQLSRNFVLGTCHGFFWRIH